MQRGEESSSPGKLSYSFPPSCFTVVPAVLEDIQKVKHLAYVFKDLSWINSFDQPLGKRECGFINT